MCFSDGVTRVAVRLARSTRCSTRLLLGDAFRTGTYAFCWDQLPSPLAREELRRAAEKSLSGTAPVRLLDLILRAASDVAQASEQKRGNPFADGIVPTGWLRVKRKGEPMTIRDCEVCPATFTATGDEVLCPVCAIARVRSRVAGNLDLAVEALTAAESVLASMQIASCPCGRLDKGSNALRLVRQALGRE